MSNTAIRIQNFNFKYPNQSGYCLSHLQLLVNKGDRFGLFGPNGAGKTTLMNCMTGVLHYQTGSIELLGKEVRTNKKQVAHFFGLVPQDFSFYHELTPTQNLAFFGAWAGMTKQNIKMKTQELLEVLDLTDVHNKPVHQFSGGMKRRVNLAIGVMHSPQLLFLDEPTVGVDVHSRQAIINYLKTLNENGTTLIYTSHQLSEAEELCHSVALMNNGSILAHNSLSELLLQYKVGGLEELFINLTSAPSGELHV